MTPPTGRIVRAAVVVIILGALVWFARSLNWTEAWRAIRATSVPVLAAAIVVNLLSLVLKGARWWVFLRPPPVGASSFKLALRATFSGAAVNNLLVANSGEAARVVVVSRAARVSSEKVLATLALDRLFEAVGYTLLLVLAVSMFTLPPGLDDMRLIALVTSVLMIALLWYLLRHPEKAELPALEGEGLLHRARRYGYGFVRTLAGLSTGPRFAAAAALSVGVWTLQVASYHLTARAAHFDISLVGTIAAVLTVQLGFVTRVTPGSVGVFQLIYAMTATAFGMDRDQATGVALLIQIQQLLPVTIIGLLATPGVLRQRRDTVPPYNIIPGEPDPSPQP